MSTDDRDGPLSGVMTRPSADVTGSLSGWPGSKFPSATVAQCQQLLWCIRPACVALHGHWQQSGVGRA